MHGTASKAATVLRSRAAHLGADDRVSLRHLGAAALATHGLFHAMGLTLLWRWNGPGAARFSALNPAAGSASGIAVGIAWLLAGIGFVGAAALLVGGHRAWRTVAASAAAVSVPALLPFTGAALYGLVVDAAVLLGLALTRSGRVREETHASEDR